MVTFVALVCANEFELQSALVEVTGEATLNTEKSRVTQNSGVVLKVDTMSYASARDRNPRAVTVTFHGVLMDIIEIRYTNDMEFVLFKCDWVNNQLEKKHDEFSFTMVNFKHVMYKGNHLGDELFILIGQAEQVVYVQDPLEPDWFIVHKTRRFHRCNPLDGISQRGAAYSLGQRRRLKIYPLAFGFAASECKGSWTWFLSELKKGIGSPQDLVIVSDRHRGIISAMNEVFPYAQHAFCVFHIAQKFRRSSKNQSLARQFFYNACYQHRRDDCDIDLQHGCLQPEVLQRRHENWGR
ncbi:hypothetical protein LWI29_020131 [Acer saccharum]|uniref:MULE transposase domain-containing protein n=1 Tax=Acer saccharum TaxID=4024 RepID=A0AA39T8F1_ACESA|nr:hypothetical protein LWI29_020131 [Acer saccharum]